MAAPSKSRCAVVPLAVAANRSRATEVTASLQLAAVLGLLWLGLFEGQQLIFGAVAVVGIVAVCRQIAPLQPIPVSFRGLCSFMSHFIVQSILGGIDVARRALLPRAAAEPGIWRYRVRLPDGQPRAVFIGCIGLIPGSVGQSLRGDELTVHSIAGDPQQGLAALEQRVAGLYGLTLSGEDG